MAHVPTTMPEERLRQLLAEAGNQIVAEIAGLNPASVHDRRARLQVPAPWPKRDRLWLLTVGAVVRDRWRNWQDGNYPEPISSDDLARLVWRELGKEPPAKPAAKAVTPGMLLVEVRRYPLDPTHQGRWPTVADLAQHLGRSVADIQPPADILLDRRMAKLVGGQLMPYEAAPGEVVTRPMTEAERAKYGPPSPRPVKPSRTEEPDDRPEPIAPEPADETPQEVQEEMPHQVNWPEPQRLLEMEAEYLSKYPGKPTTARSAMAKAIGCTLTPLYNKLRSARADAKAAQLAAADSLATLPATPAQGVGTPKPTEAQGEPTGGKEPASCLTDENIEKLGRNAQLLADAGQPLRLEAIEVKEGAATVPDTMQSAIGPSTAGTYSTSANRLLPGVDASPSELPTDPNDVAERARRNLRDYTTQYPPPSGPLALATHATLVLLDESTEYPAQVDVIHEHLTQCPDMPGDQWGQAVRVDGRRVVRIWTCVSRIDTDGGPTFILLPLGAEVLITGEVKKGAA